jgi:outer membrane biosynthesis protein TonB
MFRRTSLFLLLSAALLPIPTPAGPAQAVEPVLKFRVVIGKDGVVRDVQFVSGEESMRRMAEETLRQWRCQPAQVNGQLVESVAEVEINQNQIRMKNAPARLIHRVAPRLHGLRIAGIVRLDVVIGADGRVREAQAISGPVLLRRAAEETVKQWVYEPAMLDGNPVESTNQVDVHFVLPGLGLRTEHLNGQIRVSWNSEALEVQNAQRAVLIIQDGDSYAPAR